VGTLISAKSSVTCCLQCFDAVGWAARRASGLLQPGANNLHMVQLMPLPPHHLLLH